MKPNTLKSIILSLSLLVIAACNVDNPRLKKNAIKGNLQNIGGLTLDELYTALDSFTENTALTLGTTAEGEFKAGSPQYLNFNSGAIACRFSYESANFKISVEQDLSLGQALKIEITPITPVNKTQGTAAAKELCEQDLPTAGVSTRTSTITAASERTMAAKSLVSALKEIQTICTNRDNLQNGQRCDGIEYSISRANFYSAGPAIPSFAITLDLKTLQGNRRIDLTFIPSAAAILTGGVLQFEAESDIWQLNAGSLGTVSGLELSNLK